MMYPKKDEEFIKDLLKKPEGETLDFKHSISNPLKFARTLVSFANHLGGIIAIGINDHKRLIGIDEAEEVFMIEKSANDYCIPPIEVDFELYETYPENSKPDTAVYILLVFVEKAKLQHQVIDHLGNTMGYIRKGDKCIPIPIQ